MLNHLKGGSSSLGQELSQALIQALRVEMPQVARRWRSRAEADQAQMEQIEAQLREPLKLLRLALWALKDRRPSALKILDARPLAWAGRGGFFAGERRVAVSLAAPPAHLLCQIFHEEVHAISDAWLPKGEIPRNTHPGQPGFSRHQALEAQAIELGRRLMELVLPEWMWAYGEWAKRFTGLEVALD